MNINKIFLLCVLLALPATASSTDKAYTWTDANGTRHYSEEPPFDRNITPVEIELLPAPAAGNIGADDDFYSVVNQANRMERSRLEKEKPTSGKLQVEFDLQEAAREIELRLAPQANDYARQNPRNKPATPAHNTARNQSGYYPVDPQNAGYRQRAVPYGRPLQATPGNNGQQPDYRPVTSPKN